MPVFKALSCRRGILGGGVLKNLMALLPEGDVNETLRKATIKLKRYKYFLKKIINFIFG
jgi:hypothetical protein